MWTPHPVIVTIKVISFIYEGRGILLLDHYYRARAPPNSVVSMSVS